MQRLSRTLVKNLRVAEALLSTAGRSWGSVTGSLCKVPLSVHLEVQIGSAIYQQNKRFLAKYVCNAARLSIYTMPSAPLGTPVLGSLQRSHGRKQESRIWSSLDARVTCWSLHVSRLVDD